MRIDLVMGILQDCYIAQRTHPDSGYVAIEKVAREIAEAHADIHDVDPEPILAKFWEGDYWLNQERE